MNFAKNTVKKPLARMGEDKKGRVFFDYQNSLLWGYLRIKSVCKYGS